MPGDARRIVFTFTGAGNLPSDKDHHMHQAALAIVSKDHFKAEWVSNKEGKACHKVEFDLVRKQK